LGIEQGSLPEGVHELDVGLVQLVLQAIEGLGQPGAGLGGLPGRFGIADRLREGGEAVLDYLVGVGVGLMLEDPPPGQDLVARAFFGHLVLLDEGEAPRGWTRAGYGPAARYWIGTGR